MNATTLGELRATPWATRAGRSVKQELRDNLICRLRENRPVFPGIVGYETTVTPQVFALFNSEFAANRSLAMAARLVKERDSDDERISAAFRSVYGRPPSAIESEKCLNHLRAMTAHHQAHPPQPTELPTKVERGMVEELTGEMVYWEEDLSVLKDYQRDLMPWQVDAETRALADVCLVLMNSNEFLYVR